MDAQCGSLPGKIQEYHRVKRILINGDILSYEVNPANVVGCYIHRFPLTEENNYFEIKILDVGLNGTIAIGIAPYNYSLSSQPGWKQGSTAYHADDGKLFHDNGFGSPFGPKCNAGDVIGCGIRRSDDVRFQAAMRPIRLIPIEVFFTRNGKEIGKSTAIISANSGDIHPAIGLHSLGESVKVDFNPERTFPFSQFQLFDDAMLIDRAEEEDWSRTYDLIVNGQVIEYAGKGKSIRDVGMAQARRCLNKTYHYFEVEILEPGQHCYIAIGLVHKNYPRHRHPGWNTGSVAYHADDGQIFVGKGQGIPFGPRCYRGDVMGCGIWFQTNYESQSDNDDCDDTEGSERKEKAGDEEKVIPPDMQEDMLAHSDDENDSSGLEEDDELELLEGIEDDMENDGFLWLPRPEQGQNLDEWRQLGVHERPLGQHIRHPLLEARPFRAWKNLRRRYNRHLMPQDHQTAIYGSGKSSKVRVFFTRNGQHIGETTVPLPLHGLYPAVGMLSSNEKVKVELKPLSG